MLSLPTNDRLLRLVATTVEDFCWVRASRPCGEFHIRPSCRHHGRSPALEFCQLQSVVAASASGRFLAHGDEGLRQSLVLMLADDLAQPVVQSPAPAGESPPVTIPSSSLDQHHHVRLCGNDSGRPSAWHSAWVDFPSGRATSSSLPAGRARIRRRRLLRAAPVSAVPARWARYRESRSYAVNRDQIA